MSISVCIATYGDPEWEALAYSRALPSVEDQDCEAIVTYYRDDTVASSRNACAEGASGDWLCFLDADDRLAPGFIGAMTQALEQNGRGGHVLLTPAVQQIRNGPPGRPFFYPRCDLRKGNWLVIGTLIQRDFFWEIGGFHEHPHGVEDWNLWARAVRAGADIRKVPDAVYIAHWNNQSKHHTLSRDKPAYRAAYEAARADAWG